MRKLVLAIALSMLACAPSIVAGQEPPDGPPPEGGPGRPPGRGFFQPGPIGGDKLMLANQKSVQEELKLDAKLVKQLRARWEKQRETMEDFREMEPEAATKAIAKRFRTQDALLAKLLNKSQYKRLSEIALQQRGVHALTDPDVAKSLGITAAQKKKIDEIEETSRESMRETFAQLRPAGPGGPPLGGPGGPRFRGPQGRPDGVPRGPTGQPAGSGTWRGLGQPLSAEQQVARDEAFEQLESLRKSTDEQILAVLDEKQRSKWQAMQGEPFKGELRPIEFRRRDDAGPPEGPPSPPDES